MWMGAPRGLATGVGMSIVAGVRLAAIRWGVRLPVYQLDGE